MRIAAAAFALFALAAARGGCGSTGEAAFDPCAGKACLDSCTLCPPDDPSCVETAVAKVCDGAGRCVAETAGIACAVPDPCAGKACGQTCVIAPPCSFETPPCLVPVVAGQCDMGGSCVPGGAVTCNAVGSCMDQACGVPCQSMDCMMMGSCACDGTGMCASSTTLACMPAATDPCAGKACGDACDPCGGMCGHPYAMACDPKGQCVIGAPQCMP
jgi:hypothetical protein